MDHILIASSQAREFFSLLTETFELPVAWPMSDYGGFVSGGVALGNANVEVIRDAGTAAGSPKSRWSGVALEPGHLRDALAGLKARGIGHGVPAPFRSGLFTTLWTTVSLPEVSGPDSQVFLCEYEDDISERRSRLAEQLRARQGGPLSILSIKEVVVGAQDPDAAWKNWGRLLGPASSEGVWSLEAGPAIRVIEADEDGVRGLVVEVKSLEQARQFLKAHGVLAEDRASALTLSGGPMAGLNVTLVEAP